MEKQGDEVHMDTDEARGGSTPNVVRWVLAASLILAVVAMSAVWIIPAMMTSEDAQEATVSDSYDNASDGDLNDGVLIGDADDATTGEEIVAEDDAMAE